MAKRKSVQVAVAAEAPAAPAGRPVIVATDYRAIFFGYAEDTSGETVHLKKARMAITFGTDRGLMQLAETGPTSRSKISARADLEVRKVILVCEVTPEATAAWEAAGTLTE